MGQHKQSLSSFCSISSGGRQAHVRIVGAFLLLDETGQADIRASVETETPREIAAHFKWKKPCKWNVKEETAFWHIVRIRHLDYGYKAASRKRFHRVGIWSEDKSIQEG